MTRPSDPAPRETELRQRRLPTLLPEKTGPEVEAEEDVEGAEEEAEEDEEAEEEEEPLLLREEMPPRTPEPLPRTTENLTRTTESETPMLKTLEEEEEEEPEETETLLREKTGRTTEPEITTPTAGAETEIVAHNITTIEEDQGSPLEEAVAEATAAAPPSPQRPPSERL